MNYFNEQTPCPKCKHGLVSSDYQTESDLIKRICNRCQHEWQEKPLDGEGAPETDKKDVEF